MGFNIKHIKKYWRWVKKHQAEYKDNCKVSKEYAKRCAATCKQRIKDDKNRQDICRHRAGNRTNKS